MEQKKQTLALSLDDPLVRPNCVDVVKKLNQKYQLFILTDFPHQTPDAFGDFLKTKYETIHEKFDFLTPEQFIFTPDKLMLPFDIRIDDHAKWLTDGAKIKLLFSSPDNQDVHPEDLLRNRIIRVQNWREIDKILV